MNPSFRIRLFPSLLALLLLAGAEALAESPSPERKTIVLRDSTHPAFVKVTLVTGDIRVTCAEGREVRIEAWPRPEPPPTAGSNAPVALAANTPTNARPVLAVREEDNVVTVGLASSSPAADLRIQVPQGTRLRLRSLAKGSVHVEKAGGEIEADTVNGGIVLARVSGPVVAHAMDGRIEADFTAVPPDCPLSLTTVNGDIQATFPAKLRARFRLNSLTGGVNCDYPLRAPPALGREKFKDEAKRPSLRGKSLVGAVNGGGPDILVRSVTGAIHVRKRP